MADPAFTPFAVGRYRCIQRLSVGRSGELFIAVHRPSGETRALRRLSPDVLNDETLAGVVLRNLERLQQMEHPNVIRVHEVHEEQDEVYVATDLIRGANMVEVFDRIRETAPLSVPVATFITSQICQALDHARHLRVDGKPTPMVHGALSPTNVLLGYQGEITVSDFGAWVIPTGMHGEEGAGYSIRTQFSYRSPEHVNGSTLTTASDIFCVGILLHEMVTGQSLFLGESLMETLELVENATVGELDNVPPPLRRVLLRCLEPDPASRFGDPASVISELSVAVPRSGSREVRQELSDFLEAISHIKGDTNDVVLAPEPILPSAQTEVEVEAEEGETRRSQQRPAPPPELKPEPSVAPLSPLPGLKAEDHDIDEPTNINPTGVTEALVALSKDTTDPGSLNQLFAPDLEDEEEPTRIDPIIPGITGPEHELDEDIRTPVAMPVDPKVLWDSADDTTNIPTKVPTGGDEDTRPLPGGIFPPLSPPPTARFLDSVSTAESDIDEESTVKTAGAQNTSLTGDFTSEEEPTFESPKAESINPPPPLAVAQPTDDEEPTFPTSLEAPPSTDTQPGYEDDEPTIQATPQPLPGEVQPPAAAVASTLPWPGLEQGYAPLQSQPAGRPPSPPGRGIEETPGIESLARTAIPSENRTAPSTGELEFSYSDGGEDGVEESPPPEADGDEQGSEGAEISEVSDVATFDRQRHAQPQEGVGPFGQESSHNPESFVSGISQFDGDSIYSQSMDHPRVRFTAAHILLVVAIVVFLVAVGLLIRRLVLQSSARKARSMVQQVVDAGTVAPKTTQLPELPKVTPKPTPTPKKDPDPKTTKHHGSGRHLTNLLSGNLKSGQLRVKTNPPSTVYVNGKRLGLSPITTKVRPGDSIKLAVVTPRFEIDRRAVEIPLSRGQALEITLRKATYPREEGKRFGILQIRCKSRDRRRVLLNGKDTGFSCPGPVSYRVKPGRYLVGFAKLASGKISKRRVKVRRGRRTRVWAPRR